MVKMKLSFTVISFICSVILFGQSFTKHVDVNLSSRSGDWYAAAPIDVNNDYLLDIVFANNGSGDGVYLQLDSMTFSFNTSLNFVNQTGSARSTVWADVDNDCDLDVLWPKNTGTGNYLYENNGDGTFTRVIGSLLVTEALIAGGGAWGDYDGDGLVDLFIPRRNSNTSGLINYIYRNTGNFNFVRIDTGGTAVNSAPSTSGVWVDYDNDGDVDLYVTNRGGADNDLFVNYGGGQFIRDTAVIIGKDGKDSNGSSWGDFNNDGNLDVFVTNVSGGKNDLYQNNGNGSFTKITSGSIVNDILNGHSAYWADFDNDGYLDLFTANNSNIYPKNNLIYHNNGNGTFTKVTSGPQYTETLETYGASAADLNKDGFLDIINPQRFGGAPTIFINDGNTNNYIHLKLYGGPSNRGGLGTRLVIYSNLGMQTRFITQQSGWNNHDDLEAHFGLANDSIIDSIKVYWPSGNSCVLTGIKVPGFFHLEEGACQLDTFTELGFQASTRYLQAFFNSEVVGSVHGYHWEFGDGDTSNIADPTHNYLNPGDYQVSLTVYDNHCMRRTFKDSITICPDTTSLGFIASSMGRSVTFIDTSNSNGYQFSWDYGDGQTGQGAVSNHNYITSGVYWVCLSVTDSCRTKQYCDSVTVCDDTIISKFSASTLGLQVSFIDSSQNAQSLLWDFGDGTTGSGSNPNHMYSAPGYYVVCLTANGVCNVSVFCDTIGVCLDTAKAAFTWNSSGNLVTFNDVSTNANSYYWDFGDGNFSTQVNPTHFYLTKGTYTVCLAVTNDCFTDTICQTITLCDFNLKAGYSYSTLFSPVAIQFQDTSVDAITWFWDFDDGSTSTNQNPVNVFSGGKVYNVCLAVTDSCGSSDSTCQTIDLTKFDINELKGELVTQIFPVPADESINIQSSHTPFHYEVYDLSGSVVITGLSKDAKSSISTSHLADGLYYIRIKTNSGVAIEKMLIE